MTMADELPLEAERLLFDLALVEGRITRTRAALNRRHSEIARPLLKEIEHAPAGERSEMQTVAVERLRTLLRTVHRSEFAHLAAAIVTDGRRRAAIMRKLDAFPQLGEAVPAIEIAVEHDGERGFIIRTGGGRVFRFSLPIILDRGVWREDARYERGDAVTSDGSLWIARRDDPSHEPGKGDAWRLAVTRGRHGRDARPPIARTAT